jgi:hypothetical protein
MGDKKDSVQLSSSYGVIQLKADQVVDEWNDELEEELNEKRRRDTLTRAAPKPDVSLLLCYLFTL